MRDKKIENDNDYKKALSGLYEIFYDLELQEYKIVKAPWNNPIAVIPQYSDCDPELLDNPGLCAVNQAFDSRFNIVFRSITKTKTELGYEVLLPVYYDLEQKCLCCIQLNCASEGSWKPMKNLRVS